MAVTGPYDTAAEALAVCAGSGGGVSGDCPACVTNGMAVTITITGGIAAGVYAGTWATFGSSFSVGVSVLGGYVNVVCGGSLGWDGIDGGGLGSWSASVTTEGPPASVVYDGSDADTASTYGPGGSMADPVTAVTVACC